MCWSELTDCCSKYWVTKNGSLLEIPINNLGSFSSKNSSNKFWYMGCKLFYPPILWIWPQSITTFESIFGIHHEILHDFPINHAVLDQFIMHIVVLNQFFIHHHLLINFYRPSRLSDYFSKISPRKRWDMSNSQPLHLIHFFWDLWPRYHSSTSPM